MIFFWTDYFYQNQDSQKIECFDGYCLKGHEDKITIIIIKYPISKKELEKTIDTSMAALMIPKSAE